MKYVSVAEMIAIEREANSIGITYPLMMENAGYGLAKTIIQEFREEPVESTLGLVGSGNNGGDTLVALTHLAQAGWNTCAYIIRSRSLDDPLVLRLKNAGGKVVLIESDDYEFSKLTNLLQSASLILDGILGTGIHLPIRENLASVMRIIKSTINNSKSKPYIVAVDCPSGIDCDSGEAATECLPADMTVTMAAYKQGILKFPAYNYLGTLRLVDIGLPEGGEVLQSWQNVNRFVPDQAWVRSNLPERSPQAHKGTFGTALVIAGSVNYTGAALLAGEAAYRAGAGLVTLAVPASIQLSLCGHLPEVTWLPLQDNNGVIAAAAVNTISRQERPTALLFGPGFGLAEQTASFVLELIRQKNLPALVVDADGLKLLARIPEWYRNLKRLSIVTPHPGEMAVLTGLSTGEIQSSRVQIAERFSKEWDQVVVLKGAFTVIASPDGQTAVIPVATPALARAGTGDVLAGLIVGLLAQGISPFPAATIGAWIHAHSGVKALSTLGNAASVLAGDVLKHIPLVFSEVYR